MGILKKSFVIIIPIFAFTVAGCTQNIPSNSSQEIVEKCIITINEKKYDVTNFRDKHKGGDVFKCGEDMSEAFKNAHQNDFKRLEPFKI